MKMYSLKVPEGMLENWKTSAKRRKLTVAQMIREAVNRDIEAAKRRDGQS